MSNTIPKPSPAQQRVIDRLKAGETLSFLHGWRWNTDDEWGQAERTTTLNVLIEAALVVLDRKPIDPGIDGLPTRHEAVIVLPSVTYERADKDCWRLIRGGEVVGLVMVMADGTWTVNSPKGSRVLVENFTSPLDAIKAGQQVFAPDAAESVQ